MGRIRWSTREPDATAPLDWRVPAALLATLFLNFAMSDGIHSRVWVERPLGGWLAVTLVIALSTLPYFLLPALAVHSARKSLSWVIESSLGTVPAVAVRLATLVFLLSSLSAMGGGALHFLLRNYENHWSPPAEGAIALGLLVFVVVTTTERLADLATMARFTNKLTLAIFVAALIRVREGWPAIVGGDPTSGVGPPWLGIAELAAWVVPGAFLCAQFASRISTRKDIVKASFAGLAAPAFAALMLIGMIGTATHASTFYRPSLRPTAAMALWSWAAPSALPTRMALAAVSMFGILRLSSRFLLEQINAATGEPRRRLILKGLSVVVMAWAITMGPFVLWPVMDWSARALAAVAGVVAAGFVGKKDVSDRAPKVVWSGAVAAIAAMGVAAFAGECAVLLAWVTAFATASTADALRRAVEQRRKGKPTT